MVFCFTIPYLGISGELKGVAGGKKPHIKVPLG